MYKRTSHRQADDKRLLIPEEQSNNLDFIDPVKQTINQSYLWRSQNKPMKAGLIKYLASQIQERSKAKAT